MYRYRHRHIVTHCCDKTSDKTWQISVMPQPSWAPHIPGCLLSRLHLGGYLILHGLGQVGAGPFLEDSTPDPPPAPLCQAGEGLLGLTLQQHSTVMTSLENQGRLQAQEQLAQPPDNSA
jgi:hypothetical protein